MNHKNHAPGLWLSILLGGVVGGYSSRAHSTAGQPTYLAQAAVVDCRTTMECCIKKHPLTAAESCGATSAEIAEALNGAKVLHEATETATLKGVDVPEREEDDDDGEERPDWNDWCIEQYSRCVDLHWTGNCSDCLQRCQGQRGKWPTNMCDEPKTRRRR